MKANHNNTIPMLCLNVVVSSGSKILKWKQITTHLISYNLKYRCFQWFKDTKMKANHNSIYFVTYRIVVVSSGSKILKWKQITTQWWNVLSLCCCFQWFKDTKMKANHNNFTIMGQIAGVVSSGSKILKWKQITTQQRLDRMSLSLFPVVQRY